MSRAGAEWEVTPETLACYRDSWARGSGGPAWGCISMLPPWIESWIEHLDYGKEAVILKIQGPEGVLGFAPLLTSGAEARLIGSPDVCDYLDVVLTPGCESRFFTALLGYLRREGIRRLDLGLLRPDASACAWLSGAGADAHPRRVCAQEDVSYELPLPDSWDGYLAALAPQQRHEVRRKLRRLEEAGPYTYRIVTAPSEADAALDVFLHLFTESRTEKKEYLTPAREAFFRSLCRSMAACGLLRLGFLDIEGAPAAAVMCFDWRGTLYLYNSGFDPRFRHLNAGLLCNVLSIRDCIQQGKKLYDFLKGAEIYKQRLGGMPVPLKHCRIFLQE